MSHSPLHQYLESYNLALVDSKDPTKGRSVVATKVLPRGSVVTNSQPLGTVTFHANQHEICNYCFRKLRTQSSMGVLQRCSRCKAAFFCDMTCFKNAWLSYHQFVCKPPGDDHPQPADNDEGQMDLEMLERVALNVSRFKKRTVHLEDGTVPGNDHHGPEETVEVTMEAFFSLMDHRDDNSKQTLDQYARIAQEALQKPYMSDVGLTAQELVGYLCRFRCNNFAVCDEQLFAVGEGTYPVASLFNHSCRPNAAVIFDGALLVIKAIENIQPGQEVTIAYIDIAHSRTSRTKTLESKYFFRCQCERCDDKAQLSVIDKMLGEEESDWDKAQSLIDPLGGRSAQLIKIIEEWDLLKLTRRFNRKNNALPDPSKPLRLPYYVHFALQLLTPYLWAASSDTIRFLSPTASPKQVTSQQLVEFDDPPLAAARPRPQGDTYTAILFNTLEQALAYPQAEDMVPYRITTLSTATRLFYDEMMAGHWANATRLGMYILVQYSILYPPYHPMLAQHLLLLAKSAWNSSVQNELVTNGRKLESVNERGIRRWILLAKETISCTFGKQSNMWREVVELEWIFMREQSLK